MAVGVRTVSRDKLLARALEYDNRAEASDGPVWLPRLVDLVRQDIGGTSTDLEFRMGLEQLGVSVVSRSGYLVFTEASTDASGLRDGWALLLLAGKLFEQGILAKVGRRKAGGEDWRSVPIYSGHYWQTAHVVWGQLSTGLQVQGIEGLGLLRLCELRDESGMEGLSVDHARMVVALNSLLRVAEPSADILRAFENAAPLERLPAVWHSDDAFEALLFEACDWHLRKTYPGLEYISGLSLFPPWIFALDRYRTEHLGKSCLPDHPLIAYGKRLLAADYTGPEHPLVSEAKAEYSRRYGDSTVDDFKSQWRTLLDDEQQCSGS